MTHRGRRWTTASALATLLLAVPGTAGVAHGASADGRGGADPAKRAKRADLVVQDVTGTASGRTVKVAATVKNKPGKKKGKKTRESVVAFLLSADTTAGAGDTALGGLGVPKLRPKKSHVAGATFAVPSSVPAGSYYVIACADSGEVVREKKEQNNCRASAARVTVAATTPPPSGTVTISYSAGAGFFGTVSATASHGTCTPSSDPVVPGGSCKVAAGVGTVVLSASGVPPFSFSGYSPGPDGPCDGAQSGSTMTFTAPTSNKSCVASFTFVPPMLRPAP